MHTNPPAINTAALYFTKRLSAALESIAATPLTLVEAPMGYGKTVAVREYVRRRGTRTVWTSVFSAGEDVFWRDFCRALAQAFPHAMDTVESLSRVGYPRDAVLVDAASELLLRLDFTSETVLVADDIHLLPDSGNGGGMIALCSLLARQGLANPRIVLISRDTWPGNGRNGRAMLALKKRLTVIDRDTLALNAAEIREYFTRCGLPVTMPQALALREATGGWISALYLYLLRYSKDGELSRPSGVNALLEQEIFSLLPETARDLLLALSSLDRFSLAQAEFLLGDRAGAEAGPGSEPSSPKDAGDVLAGLQRENSFINHDPANKTYALHSLFRQYLHERFERLPAERQKAVYTRLADWFERQRDAVPAIEFCHKAGEFERALTILESDMSRNLVTEKSRFFVDLFKACPEDILNRHMDAAFKYAIAAFAAGNYPSFGSQLAWIARKCAERVAQNGENDPEVKIWRGELEFLLSLGAYNGIAAMSAHHRKANELLGRPTKLFGPESPWTLGCPSVLFMFHRQSGELDEELALMDECLPHYYTLAAMHGAGGEHQMRAEALYQRGEFTAAAESCHRAEAMARANGQVSVQLCSLFLHLRLALVDGAFEKARDMIRSMRELIHDKRNFFLLHTVDLCEGYPARFQRQLGRNYGLAAFRRGRGKPPLHLCRGLLLRRARAGAAA